MIFSKQKRKDIYLNAAQSEFNELTAGSSVIKKSLGFNEHISLSHTQEDYARNTLLELDLIDTPHNALIKDIKNIRVMAYLFAYQMCN